MTLPRLSIEVLSVAMKRGRMVVLLRVDGERQTSRALAERILSDRPNLAFHACRNACGPHFHDVIERTSIPHLLEHVIVDEQIRAEEEGSDRLFVGTTMWTDEAQGEARVEVSFGNDMVALAALRTALAYLEAVQL